MCIAGSFHRTTLLLFLFCFVFFCFFHNLKVKKIIGKGLKSSFCLSRPQRPRNNPEKETINNNMATKAQKVRTLKYACATRYQVSVLVIWRKDLAFDSYEERSAFSKFPAKFLLLHSMITSSPFRSRAELKILQFLVIANIPPVEISEIVASLNNYHH